MRRENHPNKQFQRQCSKCFILSILFFLSSLRKMDEEEDNHDDAFVVANARLHREQMCGTRCIAAIQLATLIPLAIGGLLMYTAAFSACNKDIDGTRGAGCPPTLAVGFLMLMIGLCFGCMYCSIELCFTTCVPRPAPGSENDRLTQKPVETECEGRGGVIDMPQKAFEMHTMV